MNASPEQALRPPCFALAVVLSLLVHGLVLVWPGQSGAPAPPIPTIEIAIERQAPEPPAIRPPEPEPERMAEPSRDSSDTSAAAMAGQAADAEAMRPEPDPPSTVMQASLPSVNRLDLREQISQFASEANPAERDTDPGRAIMAPHGPALPGAVGWLNDFVGPVTANVNRWIEPDGSQHTRIVLANGQVYCGKSDPPTTAELFNPSMSANVMRYRPCGRERPEPIDRSNPWVRGSGQ